MLEFVLDLGGRIATTFGRMIVWMQTHGIEFPTDTSFTETTWISVYDICTTYVLTLIIIAILIKWIVDVIRG